jgi:hypothetical protein
MVVSITDGMVLLDANPMRMNSEDGGDSWIWEPGKGFRK